MWFNKLDQMYCCVDRRNVEQFCTDALWTAYFFARECVSFCIHCTVFLKSKVWKKCEPKLQYHNCTSADSCFDATLQYWYSVDFIWWHQLCRHFSFDVHINKCYIIYIHFVALAFCTIIPACWSCYVGVIMHVPWNDTRKRELRITALL